MTIRAGPAIFYDYFNFLFAGVFDGSQKHGLIPAPKDVMNTLYTGHKRPWNRYGMKSGFLDKLIERLDKLDPGSVQNQFLHLVKEKGLLETIFQALQEGLIVLDGKGAIRYANRAAEELLGFSTEEAVGVSIRRYLKDLDWNLIQTLDESEWTRLLNREVEVTYPEHRFVAFYVVPLSAVDPSEKGAVILLRDVTSDRETTAGQIESERFNAIRLLAAGVAHEIGNPLNSLTIHLQLLERESREVETERGDELRQLIDVCKNEVFRLDRIINQFLKAVRPVQLQRSKSNVGRLLDETLSFLQHEIRDRNVLVETERPDPLPEIPVDEQQIKQAFFNLIKNAVEAMEQGGLLKITIQVDERFIAVAFHDSGPGIHMEKIGKIFEPYETTKEKGSGLGLMIVQRIVRDHGGQIEVHSDPGKGTCFTLFLPRADDRIRLLEAPREDREHES